MNKRRNEKRMKAIGVVISVILGLEVEALIYFVFGVNPKLIPAMAAVILWGAISLMIACVVDEIFKRSFGIRL